MFFELKTEMSLRKFVSKIVRTRLPVAITIRWRAGRMKRFKLCDVKIRSNTFTMTVKRMIALLVVVLPKQLLTIERCHHARCRLIISLGMICTSNVSEVRVSTPASLRSVEEKFRNENVKIRQKYIKFSPKSLLVLFSIAKCFITRSSTSRSKRNSRR